MASAEGTDSIEVESVFSSKNRDFHSSTLKSTSGTTDEGMYLSKEIEIEKKTFLVSIISIYLYIYI